MSTALDLILSDADTLLTEREAAHFLRISVNTLRWFRCASTPKDGPSFVRVGPRCVRYRVSDLKAYVRAER